MKDNFTTIAAVVDKSSSMAVLAKETILGFNEFLSQQKEQPGEATFTLALFSDPHAYQLVHDFVPLASVSELTSSTYKPSGWTALLDAIGSTVELLGARLAALPEEERPSKVLFLIMTDGEENKSRSYTYARIQEMINHQRDVYSWEFVFIGANQDAIATGADLGVAPTHSYNYAANSVGTKRLFRSVSAGVSSYRTAALGSSYTMVDPTLDNDVSTPAVVPAADPAFPFVITGNVIPVDPKDPNQ